MKTKLMFVLLVIVSCSYYLFRKLTGISESGQMHLTVVFQLTGMSFSTLPTFCIQIDIISTTV